MTPTRPPQTLAEVQVGDEVVIDASQYGALSGKVAKVERLTQTRIVTTAGAFNRRTGHEVGSAGSWHPPKLCVGDYAARFLTKLRRHEAETAFLYALRNARFTAASVRAVRAACDGAEAALRAAGEWDDEPQHQRETSHA